MVVIFHHIRCKLTDLPERGREISDLLKLDLYQQNRNKKSLKNVMCITFCDLLYIYTL